MVGLMAVITFLPQSPYPWLVYNPTESVPVGFYWITRTKAVKVGEMALILTPPAIADLADRRRYIPRHVPMLKYVAALSGDQVCASGERITINDRMVANRQKLDHAGRPMPWWTGCQTLKPSEVFVLNSAAPLSFDGRYFGVVSLQLVRGKATHL